MAASVQRFDSELIAHLRSRGHRVTSQRLILHRVLRELDRHVTAEELLEATGDRLPNVSLPTVYATLELFDDLGLVRRFSLGGGALLWDPRTQEHHHLSCRLCGRVEDLEASLGVGAARPPRRVPAAVERMSTPSSLGSCSIRTRSPSSEPPERLEDGSTASTATVLPPSRHSPTSAESSVDLPAPGGPVTPTM